MLRLCSVFQVPAEELGPGTEGFDSIGGMQNHTGTLSRCLDQLGWAQTVVTSRLGGARGSARLGSHGRLVRVGVRLRRLRQLWACEALLHVWRCRPAVDLVHVHQGEDLAVLPLGLFAAVWHRCPLVVTVHCSTGHTVQGRSPRARVLLHLGGPLERAVLRRASAVVVLAEHTAGCLRRDGLPPERIHVIPSGFDPELFAGAHGGTFPRSHPPRVGYVGRLAPQKGAHLLVDAFSRLSGTASLVIVGDGPDRMRVEQALEALPARVRVVRSGFVPHERVPALLGSLDVLVLPSTYEELGSVLIETMAVGTPIVAADVGGVPEVVRHGETGLLVPPGDVAALAAAIDLLVADGELASRLGACGRTAAQRFAWPRLAGSVAAVYDDVLSGVR
ncbi:MAG: glycosyl transferase group 1 [Frankiales bacterium]|nr:glycosyl transferase group 1 [Frankiales bacterium]